MVRSGTILGFKPDQAKDSVSGNARLAVIRGHAARQTYRGVIGNPKVVEVASPIPTQASPLTNAKSGQKAPEKVTKEVTPPAADIVPPAAEKEAVGSKRKRAVEQEASKRKKK